MSPFPNIHISTDPFNLRQMAIKDFDDAVNELQSYVCIRECQDRMKKAVKMFFKNPDDLKPL